MHCIRLLLQVIASGNRATHHLGTSFYEFYVALKHLVHILTAPHNCMDAQQDKDDRREERIDELVDEESEQGTM